MIVIMIMIIIIIIIVVIVATIIIKIRFLTVFLHNSKSLKSKSVNKGGKTDTKSTDFLNFLFRS